MPPAIIILDTLTQRNPANTITIYMLICLASSEILNAETYSFEPAAMITPTIREIMMPRRMNLFA
ncbi:hypothetical protein D3C81_2141370 [compost metagenome]